MWDMLVQIVGNIDHRTFLP